MTCDDDLCTAAPPSTRLSTLLACAPFLLTFAVTSALVSRSVFPRLHTPDSHAATRPSPTRRRIAAATVAATLGLAAVLAELILAEISELVSHQARAAALGVTIPALLFLLVVLIPALEVQSVVGGSQSIETLPGNGRPTMGLRWLLQLAAFGAWLLAFWSVGRAVPVTLEDGKKTAKDLADGGLARACLERIGVLGIFFMAWLSGFASISSPWHTFVDGQAARRRRLGRGRSGTITEADVARKQAGLDAASEMLQSKRLRLRTLEATAEQAPPPGSSGLVGSLVGSIKGIASGSGDANEMRALRIEIQGLETMEANLTSALSTLRAQRLADARAGTTTGRLLAVPTYVFSIYCIYRVLATSLTTLRRFLPSTPLPSSHSFFHSTPTTPPPEDPSHSFSSSDPINRFLGLLARHWDPKLDQLAWSRQISFLLSGVILLLSLNSALVTFNLFSRLAPSLLRTARANVALLTAQVVATYVISAALLMRGNLPKEVGRSVGDALQSALDPGFVDRWFEGWFLAAAASTAIGIWIGKKIGGHGDAGLDEWDEYGGEEMGVIGDGKGVEKRM